jgi:hypothetical protein
LCVLAKLEEAKRQCAQKARNAKECRACAKVAEETGYGESPLIAVCTPSSYCFAESEDDSDDDGTQAEVHHCQPVHVSFADVTRCHVEGSISYTTDLLHGGRQPVGDDKDCQSTEGKEACRQV